jgi:Ca2+-binding EF-hand superfamily protein
LTCSSTATRTTRHASLSLSLSLLTLHSIAHAQALSKAEIDALVARFDADKSGKVTKDEFRTLLKTYIAEQTK